MPTLAGVRSELRAMMALDERGEIDQPHRHKFMDRIIRDLQEIEVREAEQAADKKLKESEEPYDRDGYGSGSDGS
jgi:hypothetical protein